MLDTPRQKLIENPVVKSKAVFHVAIQHVCHRLTEKTTFLLWNVWGIPIRAELILDGPEQVPPC